MPPAISGAHHQARSPASPPLSPFPAQAQPQQRASLQALVVGRSRLEASRWFFDALVLQHKGLVALQQLAPYGDVTLRAHVGM